MVIDEEVQVYIPYASAQEAESIGAHIKSLYKKYSNVLYEDVYDVLIEKILKKINENYNPKLGPLIRYSKNTLSLGIKVYMSRKHSFTIRLDNDIFYEKIAEVVEEVDLSKYSDAAIKALYEVMQGRGTRKEKELVNEIFKVKE